MKAVLVVVEAPGTAPGSNGFITLSIYYHSWQASTANIGKMALIEKGGCPTFSQPVSNSDTGVRLAGRAFEFSLFGMKNNEESLFAER